MQIMDNGKMRDATPVEQAAINAEWLANTLPQARAKVDQDMAVVEAANVLSQRKMRDLVLALGADSAAVRALPAYQAAQNAEAALEPLRTARASIR